MATVKVWVAPLLVPESVGAALVASLAADERARAARYRSADDARRFCAARGWLRRVLAAEVGCQPGAVALADGPGKPRLAGPGGPCFNLSHAGDVAVVAVADREVGVDVEPIAGAAAVLDAVRVACTPAETAALDRLDPGRRAEAFLRLWTAKEAYLKARGVGLSVAPHGVHVGAERAGAMPVRLSDDAGPAVWWVRELDLGRGYVGAVAAEGRDWVVELRRAADLATLTPNVGP
jgi:4'-phosphopantetheinyl transferase